MIGRQQHQGFAGMFRHCYAQSCSAQAGQAIDLSSGSLYSGK
jgi:hypothetical protein